MFTKDQRLIYTYNNGVKDCTADPIVVFTRLAKAIDLNSLQVLLQTIASKDTTKSLDAMTELAEGVRVAFALPTFEEGGLLVSELVVLGTQFLGWLGELGDFFAQTPTSVESTGPAYSVNSIITPMSGCGSTDRDNS